MTDIDKACEIVYERITGYCLHPNVEPMIGGIGTCPDCGRAVQFPLEIPPLATSLDAWAEHIWPVMTEEQKEIYAGHLDELRVCIDCGGGGENFDSETSDHKTAIFTPCHCDNFTYTFEATPLHHLEACLRMLGEDELAEKVRKHD